MFGIGIVALIVNDDAAMRDGVIIKVHALNHKYLGRDLAETEEEVHR